MAIYKPSNLGPNLEEIDVELIPPRDLTLSDEWQANIFEAQVNTTGENVLGYRLKILENNTEDDLWVSNYISLPKKSTNYFGKPGVKNKDFVKTYYLDSEQYTSSENFIINRNKIPVLRNGKDYQWMIRMYDAVQGSTAQPITKVCDGFLVGSTNYVIWCNIAEDNTLNDLLLYDRYVEFTPKSGSSGNIFPFLTNEDEIEYPPSTGTKERIKIDWVEKGLGNNKDYTKVELVDGLKYKYIDGAQFQVFLCDNTHTLNSAYADPNSTIVNSMFMARYGSLPEKVKTSFTKLADLGTETDSATTTGFKDFRRIIGTSTVTGELRVQEPFLSVPKDGDFYVLYEFNRLDGKYSLVDGQVEIEEVTEKDEDGKDKVDANGNPIKTYPTEVNTANTQIADQRIGGNPVKNGTSVANFTVRSNRWDGTAHRLFVQPNINIKTDDTNPNEIVFDVNGVRINIIKKMGTSASGERKDVTFNKLDNTQWLLEDGTMTAVTSMGVEISSTTSTSTIPTMSDTTTIPIIPGSNYTVYTDFMDSTPNGIFYARKSPTITMRYRNMNATPSDPKGGYYEIDSTPRPWRDIEFMAEWDSVNNTQIKYYKYILYDETGRLIKEGEDTYDTDLYFWYRGFDRDNDYSIELLIVDDYNKEFVVAKDFHVTYQTEGNEAPLEVIYDCDRQAFRVHAETPLYAIQYETEKPPAEDIDLTGNGSILIPEKKILKYNAAYSFGYPNIQFIKPFSYLTQFRLTEQFISSIQPGGEKTVTEIACQRNEQDDPTVDIYKLTLSSSVSYFYNEETQVITLNENRLRLKWYKNNSTEPLPCFNNGTSTYFDIVAHDSSQTIELPTKFNYVLQLRTEDRGQNVIQRLPKDALDEVGQSNTYYILTQPQDLNGLHLDPGVYTYENGQYVRQTDTMYLFLENVSQINIPGAITYEEKYESLGVAKGTLRGENGGLNFYTIGRVWMESFDTSIEKAIQSLAQKWFMSYFVVDERIELDNTKTEICRATIEMNDNKK